MPLLKAEINRHRFYGADGKFHTIRACPASKLVELLDWFDLLNDAIAQADEALYKDFETLFTEDEVIRELCSEILECCGVKLKWVDINQVAQFIHSYEENEEFKPGIIKQINKLDKPSQGSGISIDEYASSLHSTLIGLGFAGNLKDAQEILQDVPLDLLEGAIAARIDSLKSPEDKKKDDLKKKAQEAQERQTHAMKENGLQALFDDFKQIPSSLPTK